MRTHWQYNYSVFMTLLKIMVFFFHSLFFKVTLIQSKDRTAYLQLDYLFNFLSNKEVEAKKPITLLLDPHQYCSKHIEAIIV